MAVWLLTSAFLHATTDSSYLLIQGPFGSGDSTESYKWQVNYPAGSLSTGQDLFNAVFGVPVLTTGTYAGRPVLQSQSSAGTVDYVDYTFGNEVLSITINGVTKELTPDGGTSWVYYVAGGTGDNAVLVDPPFGFAYGAYSSGAWNFSEDGADSRYLADSSYDGYVFGNNGYNPPYLPAAAIDDSTGATGPLSSEFTKTDSSDFFTVVTAVPEPATPAFLGVAAILGALVCWKKKARS